MEIHVGLFGDAANFFEWLKCAELVVGVHNGDENGFGAKRISEFIQINLAFAIHQEIGDGDALLFDCLASVENSFVLDCCGDDVRGRQGSGRRRTHSQEWLCYYPEDGVIVGLGATAGEDDLLGAGSYQRGDLFAGGLDGGAGFLAGGVNGRGIAKFGGEIGQHRVEHFRLDGCRGVVIEVDALHGSALQDTTKCDWVPPPPGVLHKERGID